MNVQVASREVLLAIPGVTSQIVDEYLALREQALANGPLSKDAGPLLREAAAFNAGLTMAATIRSEARLEDGTVFTREAVALLRPTPRKPVTFLAWREGSMSENARPSAQDATARTGER